MSLRMRKAEQYFDQMSTDCTVNSCPELLRKGGASILSPLNVSPGNYSNVQLNHCFTVTCHTAVLNDGMIE